MDKQGAYLYASNILKRGEKAPCECICLRGVVPLDDGCRQGEPGLAPVSDDGRCGCSSGRGTSWSPGRTAPASRATPENCPWGCLPPAPRSAWRRGRHPCWARRRVRQPTPRETEWLPLTAPEMPRDPSPHRCCRQSPACLRGRPESAPRTRFPDCRSARGCRETSLRHPWCRPSGCTRCPRRPSACTSREACCLGAA